MIDRLENHFIICGYGRVGRRAAEEIAASGEPFVVLDVNPAALDIARERGVLYVEGSGTDDASLTRAGIDRARGLIASADSDSENVYITLSAHSRRPDLTIVARASDSEAERKLQLAGADRVVRPYSSGRHRDGQARAEAAGGRVPRDRHVARRARPALRGDRDPARVPAGGPHDPRAARACDDGRGDRGAAQARRHVRHDAGAGRAARDRRRADRDRHRARAAGARGHVRAEGGR